MLPTHLRSLTRSLARSLAHNLVHRPWQALSALPLLTRVSLVGCAILSTLIVWAIPYAPGIDLPGHAHLFNLLAHYHDPVYGVSGFYDLQPFTPYLLTYVLGTAFAKVMGGTLATKCILWLIALATPFALLRWLDALGAERSFAFAGFALAFGYPYLWGFISFGMSLPIAFLCLEAWTRAPSRTFSRATLALSGWLVALFFTHAITFVHVALCVGLLTLLSPRSAFWRRALGLVAPFCVSVAWYFGRGVHEGLKTGEPPGADRFTRLFGMQFSVFESYPAAVLGLSMALVLVAVARPAFAGRPERWLPLALSTAAYFALPNYLMNTAYVGERFVHFVHAFAPAAFVALASDRAKRWVAPTSGLLAAAFLSICLVRALGMGQELAGIAELAERVPRGSAVRKGIGKKAADSKWFGHGQFENAAAWITADRLGMLHNDHAHYFQLPLTQAKDVPFPTRLRYVLGREPDSKGYLKYKGIKAKELARAGAWSLHEDESAPPFEIPLGTILRYGQDEGALQIDRSVSKKPLSIAGTRFPRGLGTQAHALIQLHAGATGRLVGACGVDDASGSKRAAVCTILDHRERVLHEAAVQRGRAPSQFDVAVEKGHVIYLKVTMKSGRDRGKGRGAHVDWVDLAIH